MGHPTFIQRISIRLKNPFSKKKDSLQHNKVVVVVVMIMMMIVIITTFPKMPGKAFEEIKPENPEGKRIILYFTKNIQTYTKPCGEKNQFNKKTVYRIKDKKAFISDWRVMPENSVMTTGQQHQMSSGKKRTRRNYFQMSKTVLKILDMDVQK